MSLPSKSPPRASSAVNGTALPDCWVLEVLDEIVGLLIRERGGYVFHAVIEDAWPLDGCRFPTTLEAKRAVRELMAVKRRGSHLSISPLGG